MSVFNAKWSDLIDIKWRLQWWLKSHQLLNRVVIIHTSSGLFPVYVESNLMVMISCMPSRVPMSAVFMIKEHGKVEFVPSYLVNESFLLEPIWFQESMLVHERCHILNKDCEKKRSHVWSLFKRIFFEPDCEYAADKYAYEILGEKYINSLGYLRKYPVPHLDRRIKRLRLLSTK